jgi:SAM-dependent methyltransferase
MHPTSIAPPADDALRARLHGLWSAVAGGWGAHADYVDERASELSAAMLDAADLRPGARVLELACGPGGLGLAAARRVGPDGQVLVSDVAPEMVAIAAARAKEAGLANVAAKVLDLERIAEPDAAHDAVLCREGLMFVPDPAAAAAEIARVLRPGGRAAIAVWAARERNPWLGVVLDAVTAHVGRPVPPPGVPGPFSLADPGALGDLLERAGLAEVAVTEVPVPLRARSFDEWWARTVALAGPLAGILAAMGPDDRAAIRNRAQAAVAPYTASAGLVLPGVTLLASAVRP